MVDSGYTDQSEVIYEYISSGDYGKPVDRRRWYKESEVLYTKEIDSPEAAVAASVILDEMENIYSPELFQMEGGRLASVAAGEGYETLSEGTVPELDDKRLLEAFAARVVIGDGDHFPDNLLQSKHGSIAPIDFEQVCGPETSVRRGLEILGASRDDTDIDPLETEQYLISRAEELAWSVDREKVKTRVETRYGCHSKHPDENQLPRGAQQRLEFLDKSRSLSEIMEDSF
jgi:hypothetical protein